MKMLASALALTAATILATPGAAFAQEKTDFSVCWSIYAGWMPWGYMQDSGILKKWADKYGLTIEAVQMRADMRGRGYGELLMRHCIELGREKGVRLVDLMSNAVRTDAHRFYERLGFVKSHVGFKKKLG